MHHSLFPNNSLSCPVPRYIWLRGGRRWYLCYCEGGSTWESALVSLDSRMEMEPCWQCLRISFICSEEYFFTQSCEGQNMVTLKLNTDVCYLTWYVYSWFRKNEYVVRKEWFHLKCPGYGNIGLIPPRQQFFLASPNIEIRLGRGQCDHIFLFSIVFVSTLALN